MSRWFRFDEGDRVEIAEHVRNGGAAFVPNQYGGILYVQRDRAEAALAAIYPARRVGWIRAEIDSARRDFAWPDETALHDPERVGFTLGDVAAERARALAARMVTFAPTAEGPPSSEDEQTGLGLEGPPPRTLEGGPPSEGLLRRPEREERPSRADERPSSREKDERDRILAALETEPDRSEFLGRIREALVELYLLRCGGDGDAFVTADDARVIFEGFDDAPPPEEMSRNFLGAVFRTGEWESVGMVNSTTEGRHANRIFKWRLTRSPRRQNDGR